MERLYLGYGLKSNLQIQDHWVVHSILAYILHSSLIAI